MEVGLSGYLASSARFASRRRALCSAFSLPSPSKGNRQWSTMCSTPLQATISSPTSDALDPRPRIVTSPSAPVSTSKGISASSASSKYRSSPVSARRSSAVSARSGTAWYAIK